jgi:hypothetical protein
LLLTALSLVALQHINLIGKYEFCLNQIAVNIQWLMETMPLNSEINFCSQTQAQQGFRGGRRKFAVLDKKPQ